MVGGGVVFGPKPRDYSYSLPKKAKRLAIKTILSLKAQSDTLTVVEDFSVESGKTKDFMKILRSLGDDQRTVVVLRGEAVDIKAGIDDRSEVLPGLRKIHQAGRNIPWLSFLAHNRLRAHDLFYSRRLIITESAVKKLNEFYSPQAEEAAQ
jgi:large subunit ribosomal protein L4